jgi:hypothetical protein
MRDEYDFSQSIPSPYLKKLKKRGTICPEQIIDQPDSMTTPSCESSTNRHLPT